jgi:hypothetical protein
MRGFVDFRSAREVVILAPGRAEETRRWRAVSQRVPRDAYRRIAKDRRSRPNSASREKRCRVAARIEVRESRELIGRTPLVATIREKNVRKKPGPVRPRLGVANLRRKSPPGSEAVRSGESSALVAKHHPAKASRRSTDFTSQRELELMEYGIHDGTRMASQWPDHPVTS